MPGRRLARALERGGFVLQRVRGDHASYLHAESGRVTSVPLTRRTLPVGTIAKILRDAGLAAEDLAALLD